MTDNEKLVEEAAKAIQAVRTYRKPLGNGNVAINEANDEGFARAALMVFEKAHTPTDDERDERFVTDADLDRFEATATPIYRSTFEAERASKFLVSDLGQWIIRLVAEVRRLRRSEAPEHRGYTIMNGVTLDPNRPEPPFPGEPLGEPSEAQVETACEAFYNDPSDITQWNRLAEFEGRIADKYRARMRAALRAAAEAGGEGR